MSKAREVTIFNLGGKDTIHTNMRLNEARDMWQDHLSANELMPLIDTRAPEWPLYINPDQVKCIQRVTVA